MSASFEPLLDSNVAGALGAWIGTYLLHSTALVALAWLGARFARSASTREQLWRAALIGPLLTASLQVGGGLRPLGGTWELPSAPELAAAETTVLDHAAAPRSSRTAAQPTLGRAALPTAARSIVRTTPSPLPDVPAEGRSALDLIASMLLAAGVFSLTARALQESIRAFRLGRRTKLDEPALERELNALRRDAGIRRRVRLERTAAGLSPYATGILFPRIVVPDTIRGELTPRATRAMLAHELGHIARFDAAWTAIARTLSALLFFQPLNRLVAARMDENAEFACDAFAVRLTGDEVAMAGCLTTVAEWLLGAAPAATPACPMAHRRSKLTTRIERILDTEEMPRPARVRAAGWIAVALTAAAAPAVAGAAVETVPPPAGASADAPHGPSEVDGRTVASPDFAVIFDSLAGQASELRAAAAALESRAQGRPDVLARLEAFTARADRVVQLTQRVARSLR